MTIRNFSKAVFVGGLSVVLVFGLTQRVESQETRTVRGQVLTVGDSSALSGVTVRAPGVGVGAMTDESGRFTLRGIPRTRFPITFLRMGIVPDTVWIESDRDEITVYLRSLAVRLEAIHAEASILARERFDEIVQPSVVTIDAGIIGRLPGLMEPDVVKVVQLLPGTVSTNDYSVGFNVRGGEPDQNLIQMDGITVFNPTHLGGLFSTFDANAVQDVEFITGGFPAEYGGRLSSVMDVDIRAGRNDRIGVQGLVSLLSSKLLVEGPVGGTGLTFLVAGRRTYADVLTGLVSDATMPYYFYDTVSKLALPVGNGGLLSFTAYLGRDVIDWPWIEDEPGRNGVTLQASFGNRLAGFRFNHPLGSGNITIDANYTSFSPSFGLEPGFFRIENQVTLWATNFLFALSPNENHDLRFGAGYEDYLMTYDAGGEAFGAEFYTVAYAPKVWSAFVDDQWKPTEWLFLRPGVRVEAVQGPDVVNVAPRVAAKAFFSKDFAVTASAGRYYQTLHSLRDQNIPWNMIDFWIGADQGIPVARSDHLVLGFERWFSREVSLSIEGYYKTFDNIVDYNTEENPDIRGDETIPMAGEAKGIDILLRKHAGAVTGWIAYGIQKTDRRSSGVEFPAIHDRRHTLNIVMQSPGPLGSEMSMRFGYGSPLPYTPFVGEWTHRFYYATTHTLDDYELEPVASPTLNSGRYPHYSRSDISFSWEIDKWGGVLRPYVQLVNAMNRKNVFLYTYNYTTVPATRSAISQLPLLPSIGMEFTF
ncbi:MAG: TonB-dependent receptor [Gemmatimonadota bacterium]|nr:TonB-dependent receptor [Gemmatimonadota bacterium]